MTQYYTNLGIILCHCRMGDVIVSTPELVGNFLPQDGVILTTAGSVKLLPSPNWESHYCYVKIGRNFPDSGIMAILSLLC